MGRTLTQWLCVLALGAMSVAWATSCGGEDDSTSETTSFGGGSEVTGSLKGISGSTTENNGWLVVFIERDTGISRVAQIDESGSYSINNLRTSVPQTIVLLNPQFVVQSVLTAVAQTENSLQQYFTITPPSVPGIIHNGNIAQFTDFGSVNFTNDYVLDEDGDGIPDELSGSLGFRLNDSADTDADGTPNTRDMDIDGDGIINQLDSDLDGDGTQNIFDSDANDNETTDSTEPTNELYFSQGIEYFGIQVAQAVTSDETLETTLVFTGKLRAGTSPTAVEILGPESLFENAGYTVIDPDNGTEDNSDWDLTLADDGLNFDSGAGDLIYARRVTLDESSSIFGNQALFLRLRFGESGEATTRFVDFPYTLPNIDSAAVSAVASENSVGITGTPFTLATDSTQVIENYSWVVVINDQDDGSKVYSSNAQESSTTDFDIPQGALPEGTYDAKVVVQATDRIPGIPSWTIESQPVVLTVTH